MKIEALTDELGMYRADSRTWFIIYINFQGVVQCATRCMVNPCSISFKISLRWRMGKWIFEETAGSTAYVVS